MFHSNGRFFRERSEDLTESRTSGAVEAIRSMIVTGALRPGDRLPPEAELAEQLALSRSSLREAVRALTFIGVLRTRQGDGTYVTDLDGASLLDTLGFVVDLASEQTLIEFFELRRLLEPATASLAAARATDDDIETIEGCLGAMVDAAAAGDRDGFIDADLGFHHTVADIVGNTVLSSLLRGSGSARSGCTSGGRVWTSARSTGRSPTTAPSWPPSAATIPRRRGRRPRPTSSVARRGCGGS